MFHKNLFFLSIVIILLLLVSSSTHHLVSAKWTVIYPGGRSSFPETILGGTSTSSVKIVARNTVAKFQTKMQNDRSVFPGSCVSDANGMNPLGWDTYKHEMVRSLSVSVNLNTVTILLWPRIGFSILKAETITCGPFKSKHDEPYWHGGSLAVDDQHFSFTIVPASRAHVSLYQVINPNLPLYQSFPVPDLNKYPESKQIHENWVKQTGLNIYMVLSAGAWNSSLVQQVGESLTCKSTSSDFDCFSSSSSNSSQKIVNPETDFYYLPSIPCVILVNISAEQLQQRNFTLNNEMVKISFHLPNNGIGFEAGMMNKTKIEQAIQSNSFLIVPGGTTTTTLPTTSSTTTTTTTTTQTSTTTTTSITSTSAAAPTTTPGTSSTTTTPVSTTTISTTTVNNDTNHNNAQHDNTSGNAANGTATNNDDKKHSLVFPIVICCVIGLLLIVLLGFYYRNKHHSSTKGSMLHEEDVQLATRLMMESQQYQQQEMQVNINDNDDIQQQQQQQEGDSKNDDVERKSIIPAERMLEDVSALDQLTSTESNSNNNNINPLDV